MKKVFCKNDVFDVNSCENIRINCEGYFFNKIPKNLVIPKSQDAFFLKVINSLKGDCFGTISDLWQGDKVRYYPYFVPASLVFEKPETRPFETFEECFRKIDDLSDDEDIDIYGELGIRFDYRFKNENELRTELVTGFRVQRFDNGAEVKFLNNSSFEWWFNNCELLINGDWVCFGIEE